MGFLEYTKWVIVNKQGDPWSDDWGWVDQNSSFSVYNDRKGILPMEGRWITFQNYRRKWLQARINALDCEQERKWWQRKESYNKLWRK